MCTAASLAPQRKQGPSPGRELDRERFPRRAVDGGRAATADGPPPRVRRRARRRASVVPSRPAPSEFPGSSEQPRDVLEPGHQRRRQVDARHQHQTEMHGGRHVGGFDRSGAPARARRRRGPAGAAAGRRTRPADRRPATAPATGCAREGRAHHQELAGEDAERRQAGDGDHAEHQAPAEHRMASPSGPGCRRSAGFP